MGFKPRIEIYHGKYLIVDASFDPAIEIERYNRRIDADIALASYIEKAQCYGKEAFTSFRAAESQRGRYEKEYDVRYRTYECEICKLYHLTKSLKPRTYS
jgi:hypothetical protein